MTIGARIKKERKQKKLSQKELADRCGLSPSYIQQLELGQKTNPSLETTIKISSVLGFNVQLLNDKSAHGGRLMTIGENIKKERNQKKITQVKLGEMIGVTGAYVQQLEKGVKLNPSMEIIFKLSSVLGIDINELRTPKDEKKLSNIEMQYLKSYYTSSESSEIEVIFNKIRKASITDRIKINEMIDILLKK